MVVEETKASRAKGTYLAVGKEFEIKQQASVGPKIVFQWDVYGKNHVDKAIKS